MLDRLLVARANVNAADHNGFTALYWANSEGHHDAYDLLLDAGAYYERV